MTNNPKFGEWEPIDTAPKDIEVLIAFKNRLDKWRIIKAMYFSKFKHESECGDEFCEYDENTDMYFTPEGWYEAIYSETGLDYGYIFLGEDPTHWTLVPKPPKENNVETTPIFNPDSKVEVSDDCKITTTFAAKENKDA